MRNFWVWLRTTLSGSGKRQIRKLIFSFSLFFSYNSIFMKRRIMSILPIWLISPFTFYTFIIVSNVIGALDLYTPPDISITRIGETLRRNSYTWRPKNRTLETDSYYLKLYLTSWMHLSLQVFFKGNCVFCPKTLKITRPPWLCISACFYFSEVIINV